MAYTSLVNHTERLKQQTAELLALTPSLIEVPVAEDPKLETENLARKFAAAKFTEATLPPVELPQVPPLTPSQQAALAEFSEHLNTLAELVTPANLGEILQEGGSTLQAALQPLWGLLAELPSAAKSKAKSAKQAPDPLVNATAELLEEWQILERQEQLSSAKLQALTTLADFFSKEADAELMEATPAELLRKKALAEAASALQSYLQGLAHAQVLTNEERAQLKEHVLKLLIVVKLQEAERFQDKLFTQLEHLDSQKVGATAQKMSTELLDSFTLMMLFMKMGVKGEADNQKFLENMSQILTSARQSLGHATIQQYQVADSKVAEAEATTKHWGFWGKILNIVQVAVSVVITTVALASLAPALPLFGAALLSIALTTASTLVAASLTHTEVFSSAGLDLLTLMSGLLALVFSLGVGIAGMVSVCASLEGVIAEEGWLAFSKSLFGGLKNRFGLWLSNDPLLAKISAFLGVTTIADNSLRAYITYDIGKHQIEAQQEQLKAKLLQLAQEINNYGHESLQNMQEETIKVTNAILESTLKMLGRMIDTMSNIQRSMRTLPA